MIVVEAKRVDNRVKYDQNIQSQNKFKQFKCFMTHLMEIEKENRKLKEQQRTGKTSGTID